MWLTANPKAAGLLAIWEVTIRKQNSNNIKKLSNLYKPQEAETKLRVYLPKKVKPNAVVKIMEAQEIKIAAFFQSV